MMQDIFVIDRGTWEYDGDCPIEPADAAEAIADGAVRMRTTIAVPIEDMIGCAGDEGWQEYLDERIGFPLTDPMVRVDPAATRTLPREEQQWSVAVTVTGGMDPADIDVDAATSPVQVRFFPEEWEDGWPLPAIEREPAVWFVSERTAAQIGRALDAGRRLDFAQFDAFAPRWVREWEGPFAIETV